MNMRALPVAEELFAAFPQWRSLARTDTAKDGSVYLVVEVAPPEKANVQHGLMINTSNEEITVGFDNLNAMRVQRMGITISPTPVSVSESPSKEEGANPSAADANAQA